MINILTDIYNRLIILRLYYTNVTQGFLNPLFPDTSAPVVEYIGNGCDGMLT